VSRLTAKLSEMQLSSSHPPEHEWEEAHESEDDVENREAASGSLTTQKIQPLLHAYDDTIRQLQDKLSDRKDEVARFEHKLDEISSENVRLVERLREALQDVASHVRPKPTALLGRQQRCCPAHPAAVVSGLRRMQLRCPVAPVLAACRQSLRLANHPQSRASA
jgi:TolA-binding protein